MTLTTFLAVEHIHMNYKRINANTFPCHVKQYICHKNRRNRKWWHFCLIFINIQMRWCVCTAACKSISISSSAKTLNFNLFSLRLAIVTWITCSQIIVDERNIRRKQHTRLIHIVIHRPIGLKRLQRTKKCSHFNVISIYTFIKWMQWHSFAATATLNSQRQHFSVASPSMQRQTRQTRTQSFHFWNYSTCTAWRNSIFFPFKLWNVNRSGWPLLLWSTEW